MVELLESIGHNIRRLRDEKGWNQTELGFHADTSPSIISLIENGKRNPSTATLAKIAGALGVEVVDLFPKGGRSSPEPSLFNGIEGERPLRYLRAWRVFVYRIEERWKEEPPTKREIATLRDTMTALVEQGVFDASDASDSSEQMDLQFIMRRFEGLNAIADSVEKDEEAKQRRDTFTLIRENIGA